jgi:tetratricopeptide (TPR) repeat protein
MSSPDFEEKMLKDQLAVRLVLIVLVGLGCTLPPCQADEIGAPKTTPATPADKAYGAGVEALKKGDLQAAKAQFDRSLELNPKQTGALLGLAEVAIAKGNPKDAAEPLKKAVAAAPDDAKVETTWGHYLFWQKQYPQAQAAFEKAIRLDPSAARPHIELADLYFLGLHQPKPAIEHYRKAISLDPADAFVHFTLGKALAEAGELDQAEDELTSAARLAPSNPAFLQALGDFQVRRRELDRALATYARVIEVQPKFVSAYVSRGDIFTARGELEKALPEYQAASKANPKFALAYLRIGMIEERRQRVAEAEHAYRTAVQLDPKLAVGYNNLAWLAAGSKTNLDQALAWAQKAVELDPRSPEFQDTLGWVYRARGERQKAIDVLQKASAAAPRAGEVYYHLGVVYAEMGQAQQARQALNKAVTLGKDFEGSDDAKARLTALNGAH